MGADMKQIKNRITSVGNTLHITRAMKLVASSKMSSFGFGESETFIVPPGVNLDLSCTGDEIADAVEQTGTVEDYYFE